MLLRQEETREEIQPFALLLPPLSILLFSSPLFILLPFTSFFLQARTPSSSTCEHRFSTSLSNDTSKSQTLKLKSHLYDSLKRSDQITATSRIQYFY